MKKKFCEFIKEQCNSADRCESCFMFGDIQDNEVALHEVDYSPLPDEIDEDFCPGCESEVCTFCYLL